MGPVRVATVSLMARDADEPSAVESLESMLAQLHSKGREVVTVTCVHAWNGIADTVTYSIFHRGAEVNEVAR